MAKFLTTLKAELLDEYDGGREVWRLLEPLEYESDLAGRITVPAGFVTDGGSVPKMLSGLSGPPCRKAGVVHDWLYQSHSIASRDTADAVYHEAMLACGLDPVWAQQRLSSVSFYGKPPWESGPDRLRVLPA